MNKGVQIHTIDSAHAGQRIDNYLVNVLKSVPKGHVYKLLRKGEVRVNGGRKKPTYKLSAGDQVRIPPVRVRDEDDTTPPHSLLERLKQSIIFEDDELLVLNKPSGMAVHGGSGIRFGVIEGMRALRPELERLELVHRLDRETSGCLLMVKSRHALVEVNAMLREGRAEKQYLALLCGEWQGGDQTVNSALRKGTLQSGERMVQVDDEGKDSVSHFQLKKNYPGAALMSVVIETGRTHQIRVHAQSLGHAIVGDDKYGDRKQNKLFKKRGVKRLFLHAESLVLPWQGGLTLHAPLSDDLQLALQKLEDEREV